MNDRPMTIADYAAIPLDLSHLPEFSFSPRAPRVERPAPRQREDRTPKGPMLPARRTVPVHKHGKTQWAEIGPRTLSLVPVVDRDGETLGYAAGGTADPTWVTQFTTKFSAKPAEDAPLLTPRGAQKPMPSALSRIEELDWLIKTQHLELATDMATFEANDLDARSLRAADDEEMQIASEDVRRTPFAVRLADEIMEHPDTGEPVRVPRYGDLRYISAMKRRIEWEQYSDACFRQPFVRAFFEGTTDGRTGIGAIAKRATAEQELDARRRVKSLWLQSHEALPLPGDIKSTPASVRDLMTSDEHHAHENSVAYGNEDPDPQRIEFHAEPDPKPQRDQYAFGYCSHRCDLTADEHNGCSIDGWDLFHLDLNVWRERQTDRGYAGPSGFLGLYEAESPEEDDEAA